ncbi:MAG: YraN family protein [Bacillota bacterium]|jgi:putative endonuclease|nr:YraN family protein [Candidatus Fermentithermobacillaceae bacterium]
MSKASRNVGSLIEDAACDYLASLGYHILERNYTCRLGEVDAVAHEGGVTVFIEIRYRGKGSLESPAESLGPAKLRRLRLAIRHYVARRPVSEETVFRVDVCLARPVSETTPLRPSGDGGLVREVQVPPLGPVRFEILKGVVDFG